MKRTHRPVLAVLLSLLLLCAQQAAFAHLLSHAPGMDKATAQYQDDHAALDGIAETCGSCIAFAGIGGAAPSSAAPFLAAADVDDRYRLPQPVRVSSRPIIHCRARAPPAVL